MSEFLVGLLGERLVNSEKAEVDVHSLGAKLSLVGLFFGCSLNAPCKQFNGSLCEFYSRFKKASEHKDKLDVVFISSDQDQKHWQDFLQEMPWPALPFKDRHKKVRGRREDTKPPHHPLKPVLVLWRGFRVVTGGLQSCFSLGCVQPLAYSPSHHCDAVHVSVSSFVQQYAVTRAYVYTAAVLLAKRLVLICGRPGSGKLAGAKISSEQHRRRDRSLCGSRSECERYINPGGFMWAVQGPDGIYSARFKQSSSPEPQWPPYDSGCTSSSSSSSSSSSLPPPYVCLLVGDGQLSGGLGLLALPYMGLCCGSSSWSGVLLCSWPPEAGHPLTRPTARGSGCRGASESGAKHAFHQYVTDLLKTALPPHRHHHAQPYSPCDSRGILKRGLTSFICSCEALLLCAMFDKSLCKECEQTPAPLKLFRATGHGNRICYIKRGDNGDLIRGEVQRLKLLKTSCCAWTLPQSILRSLIAPHRSSAVLSNIITA
ncbi:unnamed protein product [Pleuronectes platessa]|uniref:Thioredoxin-like fold domain-containing protein n=1 Tax=Pleuronectes platessa TaxID=8262 RepID=A0A9N7UIM3_PLEPL|nr:unnamed protein product [Pleuronectes platessa]